MVGRSVAAVAQQPSAVPSEIGRLRKVLLHSPGRELELVLPCQLQQMLQRDTLQPAAAQRNHAELREILRHAGVQTYELRDLLFQTLCSLSYAERARFDQELVQLSPGKLPLSALQELSPAALTELCISGTAAPNGAGGSYQGPPSLDPLPNLMFVRDPAGVVNSWLWLGSMAHACRARERLIFKWVASRHPTLAGASRLHSLTPDAALDDSDGPAPAVLEALLAACPGWPRPDLARSRPHELILEGGNLLMLDQSSLLVGYTRRASPSAIAALTCRLLECDPTLQTVFVALVDWRSPLFAGHFDTCFAPLFLGNGRFECLIHPLLLDQLSAVVRISRSAAGLVVERLPGLRAIVEEFAVRHGADPILLPLGGYAGGAALPLYQEREWYQQAANVLALAPGKLVSFRRNRRTLEVLKQAGYRELPARSSGSLPGFLDWDTAAVESWMAEPAHRTVITMADEELSRANGGPRSLVLPLQRDQVSSL